MDKKSEKQVLIVSWLLVFFLGLMVGVGTLAAAMVISGTCTC